MKKTIPLKRPVVYDTKYMFEARTFWGKRIATIVAPTKAKARKLLTRRERLFAYIRPYRYRYGDFQLQ